MEDERTHRRLRVVLDIERRPLTGEERSALMDAVERTPNAVAKDYNSAWLVRLAFEEPTDEPIELGTQSVFASGEDDERLPEVLDAVAARLSVQLRNRLAREWIPLDPRFAEVVGTGRLASRAELATAVAQALDLPAPQSAASTTLLVELAISAHRCYQEFPYSYDATADGSIIGGGAIAALPPGELPIALKDLSLADEVDVWEVAAKQEPERRDRLWPAPATPPLVADRSASAQLAGPAADRIPLTSLVERFSS